MSALKNQVASPSPLPRTSVFVCVVCMLAPLVILPCAVSRSVDTAQGTMSSSLFMAPPTTTTSQALLGLLSLRSWTTYELAKQVQRSVGWFWPRAERKLYDEPKRLAAAALAKSSAEMTGARPRTVYTITARGRKALQRWLDEPPVPPSLEFEGLVKVFFADNGSLEQLRSTLERIAETSD